MGMHNADYSFSFGEVKYLFSSLCWYFMIRSTKSVFNNIQVNGTMTFIKRKTKNSQQPGELNPS